MRPRAVVPVRGNLGRKVYYAKIGHFAKFHYHIRCLEVRGVTWSVKEQIIGSRIKAADEELAVLVAGARSHGSVSSGNSPVAALNGC